MINRMLAITLIAVTIGVATAQAAMGTTTSGHALLDLTTTIGALVRMETTTDHRFDEPRATAMLGVLQELQGAPAVTPDVAESFLERLLNTLTPEQAAWIDDVIAEAEAERSASGDGARMRFPAANPFTVPPMSVDLEALIDLLSMVVGGQD